MRSMTSTLCPCCFAAHSILSERELPRHGGMPRAGAPIRLASKWLQRRARPDDCSDLLILEEHDVHARQAVHLTSSRKDCGHMQREFCAKEILENVQRDVPASLDKRSKQAPKPRKKR